MIRVTGRILDKETGQGVPGVEVRVATVRDHRYVWPDGPDRHATTDKDGRYVGFAQAGEVHVYGHEGSGSPT